MKFKQLLRIQMKEHFFGKLPKCNCLNYLHVTCIIIKQVHFQIFTIYNAFFFQGYFQKSQNNLLKINSLT